MRTQTIALAVLCSTLIYAPSALGQFSTVWIAQYGTDQFDFGRGITVDLSGTIWVAGDTSGSFAGATNSGLSDFTLSRVTSSGSVTSTQQNGSAGNDFGYAVAPFSPGLALLGGTAGATFNGQPSNGDFDSAFLRYSSSSGSLISARLTGTVGTDEILGLTSRGTSIYSAGHTDGSHSGQINLGGTAAVITKYGFLNPQSPAWTRFVTTGTSDIGYGVGVDTAGMAYLTGSTNGTLPGATYTGNGDIFMVKYDLNGSPLLTIERGTSSADEARAITVDTSGNIYLAGNTRGNLDGQSNAGGSDGFLTKLDSAGTLLWTRLIGSTADDVVKAIALDTNGNLWIGGASNGNLAGHINAGDYDGFVAQYDDAGNLIGTQFVATNGVDRVNSLAASPDGGVLITGETDGILNGTNTGGFDVFVARIVPEPGSGVLIVGVLGGLFMRRHRRKTR